MLKCRLLLTILQLVISYYFDFSTHRHLVILFTLFTYIVKIVLAEFLGLASNECLNTLDWTVTYLFKTQGRGAIYTTNTILLRQDFSNQWLEPNCLILAILLSHSIAVSLSAQGDHFTASWICACRVDLFYFRKTRIQVAKLNRGKVIKPEVFQEELIKHTI